MGGLRCEIGSRSGGDCSSLDGGGGGGRARVLVGSGVDKITKTLGVPKIC